MARNVVLFALAVLTGAGLAGAGIAGCGPSLRRVEQANVYFERCHAADRDPRRDDLERRACWQAWRDHYEVGQPDDRLDYVRERLVMLDPASGDALTLSAPEATSPDLAGSEMASPDLAGSENVSSTMAGETAADALGTPQAVPPEGPELSDSVSDRPPRARRRPTVPRTRTSACGNACEPSFVECASECRVADRGCADACRHIFRQCARGCY